MFPIPIPNVLTIERLVTHYPHLNIDLIRQAINLLDWEKAFSNHSAIKQVSLFHEA